MADTATLPKPERDVEDVKAVEARWSAPSTGASSLARSLGVAPVSMPDTSKSDAALKARLGSAEREAGLRERGAEERRLAADDLSTTLARQATERQTAKPPDISGQLPAPPSTAPRPFLSPGESLLSQLQAVMLGIGQLAMGMQGLRGSGIAATAALKGMAQGWAEGDAERVKRSVAAYELQTARLLEQHKLQRESYLDLVADHARTAEEKFGLIELRAKMNGDLATAEAARGRGYEALFSRLSNMEKLELGVAKANAQIAEYRGTQERLERDHRATEQHRRTTEEQARARLAATEQARRTSEGFRERGLKLREQTAAGVQKLEQQDVALTQRLDGLQKIRNAVTLLDREGVLPRGATVWDKGRAALALQTKPGRADIANAVEVLNRLGTAQLVGMEVALGMTGSALRLKVIGEAEAKNAAGIPKAFWDDFLPSAEKTMRAQQALIRRRLSITPVGGGTAAPIEIDVSADEWGE